MNIFKKINDQQHSDITLPIDPNELFYSLKKEKEYSYLRGIQEEALSSWHFRRKETNVLVKMNTGAGKTLVGLLILYSKLIETNKKSIFLCPDKQLVNQVFDQSSKYGIPTCIIDSDNEFPEDFLNNNAILITTVQKLFNGKNIFDRYKIDIGSIVIDDAHKCIEKIQESFAIKLSNEHGTYNELFKLFSEELKKQAIGSYEAIKSGQPDYYMKVPFWSWLDNKENVIRILSPYLNETDTLLFKWDLFHNNYNQYELYISSSKIEIVPQKCYVQNIQTYANAEFKYALSATFENDIALMYDLDFSSYSIQNPIEPKHRKDYGQRLILTPKRYFKDFNEDDLVKVVQHHLKSGQNILVLVPSFREARSWESIGARIINENIELELEKLKKSKANFIVLANRYDGIDLGGDACNVLIIHEHPKYKFLKDRYLENILHKTNTNIIAQTIEQGMGRTVRSGNDYSVIYLFGKNILRFLRHKENFKYLNKHTKRQIEIGLNLLSQEEIDSSSYAKAIFETADFCLSQNDEWLKYYQNFMKGVDDENDSSDKENQLLLKELEQQAILNFVNGKNEKAVEFANKILTMDLSDSERALYNLFCANMIYLYDKNISNDLILKARDYSRHMFEPFLSKQYLKKQLKTGNQFISAINFIHSFTTMNDAIDYLNEMKSKLKFDPRNSADDFEEAIRLLGKMLGFYSTRPEKEKNEGPDNLWMMQNNCCLILESKSEKEYKNLISKSDISQLLHSLEWFDSKYLNDDVVYYGVTVQYNKHKENGVVIKSNILAFDSNSLEKMHVSIARYIDFLSKNKINELTEEKVRAEFISNNFTNDVFVASYLKKIT
jgi:hypothetical protein